MEPEDRINVKPNNPTSVQIDYDDGVSYCETDPNRVGFVNMTLTVPEAIVLLIKLTKVLGMVDPKTQTFLL